MDTFYTFIKKIIHICRSERTFFFIERVTRACIPNLERVLAPRWRHATCAPHNSLSTDISPGCSCKEVNMEDSYVSRNLQVMWMMCDTWKLCELWYQKSLLVCWSWTDVQLSMMGQPAITLVALDCSGVSVNAHSSHYEICPKIYWSHRPRHGWPAFTAIVETHTTKQPRP